MTLLYGVNYDPILDEIEVQSVKIAKETPKTYRVEKYQAWLGYKNVLNKKHDKNLIFFNPQDAIRTYIARKEAYINDLESKLAISQDKLDKAKKLLEALDD